VYVINITKYKEQTRKMLKKKLGYYKKSNIKDSIKCSTKPGFVVINNSERAQSQCTTTGCQKVPGNVV
jgi:hypothetical protein